MSSDYQPTKFENKTHAQYHSLMICHAKDKTLVYIYILYIYKACMENKITDILQKSTQKD